MSSQQSAPSWRKVGRVKTLSLASSHHNHLKCQLLERGIGGGVSYSVWCLVHQSSHCSLSIKFRLCFLWRRLWGIESTNQLDWRPLVNFLSGFNLIFCTEVSKVIIRIVQLGEAIGKILNDYEFSAFCFQFWWSRCNTYLIILLQGIVPTANPFMPQTLPSELDLQHMQAIVVFAEYRMTISLALVVERYIGCSMLTVIIVPKQHLRIISCKCCINYCHCNSGI